MYLKGHCSLIAALAGSNSSSSIQPAAHTATSKQCEDLKVPSEGEQPVAPLILHPGATVRYSAAASQKTRERIARALPGSGHRMFLLNRKVEAPLGSEGGPAELFDVLGATGNGGPPAMKDPMRSPHLQEASVQIYPCLAAPALHRSRKGYTSAVASMRVQVLWRMQYTRFAWAVSRTVPAQISQRAICASTTW